MAAYVDNPCKAAHAQDEGKAKILQEMTDTWAVINLLKGARWAGTVVSKARNLF